jgi:serine/threonine protein kinase
MPTEGPTPTPSSSSTPTTPRSGIKFAPQDAVVINAINEATRQPETFLLNAKGMIGKGGKAEIVYAQQSHADKLVVAKIFDPNYMSAEIDYQRECRNLKICGRLIANVTTHFGYCIIMEHFPGIDLLHYLYQKISDPTVSKEHPDYYIHKYEYDIFEILRLSILAINEVIFLHSLGLAHRDLKPENFVLDTTCTHRHRRRMRIVDLDSGVLVEKECAVDLAGTDGYLPPELSSVSISDRLAYSFANDLFSLGIVLAEILTKFNYQREIRIIQHEQALTGKKEPISSAQIKACMPDVFDSNSPHYLLKDHNMSTTQLSITAALLDLIECLTCDDPSKRPSLKRLTEHNQFLTSLECKFNIEQQIYEPLTPLQKLQAYRSKSNAHLTSAMSSMDTQSSSTLESVTSRRLRSITSPPIISPPSQDLSLNSNVTSCSSTPIHSSKKNSTKSKKSKFLGGMKKLGRSLSMMSLSHEEEPDIERWVENPVFRTFIPKANLVLSSSKDNEYDSESSESSENDSSLRSKSSPTF